jgi:hypothetical protein
MGVNKDIAHLSYLLRHRIRPNLVMRRLNDKQCKRDLQNSVLLYQNAGTNDTNDPEAAWLAKTEEETEESRRKKRPLF